MRERGRQASRQGREGAIAVADAREWIGREMVELDSPRPVTDGPSQPVFFLGTFYVLLFLTVR